MFEDIEGDDGIERLVHLHARDIADIFHPRSGPEVGSRVLGSWKQISERAVPTSDIQDRSWREWLKYACRESNSAHRYLVSSCDRTSSNRPEAIAIASPTWPGLHGLSTHGSS